MLERFNEIYNLPKGTPFKRLELENAIIEKFGDIHYNKYEDIFKKEGSSKRYFVGCKNNWGLYELSSTPHGSTVDEALLLFFIKYGVEPEEGTEEYYIDNFKEEIHEIVKNVYKSC